MNNTQRLILILYALLISSMVLYPPFNLVIQGNLVCSEYSWLWEPIMYGVEYGNTPLGTIDALRLSMQMLGASLVAIALILFFTSKNRGE